MYGTTARDDVAEKFFTVCIVLRFDSLFSTNPVIPGENFQFTNASAAWSSSVLGDNLFGAGAPRAEAAAWIQAAPFVSVHRCRSHTTTSNDRSFVTFYLSENFFVSFE
jgi:hypothetical protein